MRCAGQECEVSAFLHTLRVRLWAEHLGMLDVAELTASRPTHQVCARHGMPRCWACAQGARVQVRAQDTVLDGVARELEDAVEAYDSIWFPMAAKNTAVYESGLLARADPVDTTALLCC